MHCKFTRLGSIFSFGGKSGIDLHASIGWMLLPNIGVLLKVFLLPSWPWEIIETICPNFAPYLW
jgi:hypothetical protein